MATPALDTGLLTYFTPLFVFLLIFAVFYAMFQWSKLFGDNKVLHSIIAIVIGLFGSLLSPTARTMIEYIIPWFTFLMIFGVMIIIIFKMFGVSDSSLTFAVKSSGVMWTIIIIAVVIALGALSNAFGQSSLTYTNPDANSATNENTNRVTGTTENLVRSGSGDLINAGQNQEVGIINPGNPGTTNMASNDFNTNLGATFYNPKVLGALFILLLASVGVRMLTAPVTPL
jgi:hypothetical protein